MNKKSKARTEVLLIFVISLVLLIFALMAPFVSIQFHPEVPLVLEQAKELVYLSNSNPISKGVLDTFIESFFGEELFSPECRPKWNDCFREWLAQKSGFHTGKQYLPSMIFQTMVQGNVFLGILIIAFSFVFPLIKIFLGLLIVSNRCSVRTMQRYYRFLLAVGRWSMTDVFLVALLILFVKAEHIHLAFFAEIGLYCFAASTIFSSLGSYQLGRLMGAKLVFDDAATSES